MRLGYSGPCGQFPVYRCEFADTEHGLPRCQEVRGLGPDAEVKRLLLQALEPDRIALALAGLEELGKEPEASRHQRELHLQRLQYEADRARRQSDVVEPGNRLVARNIERAWEEKLRASEKAKQEHQSWLGEQRIDLSAADRGNILALGADLPKVWHASSTTAAERKQILRYVIKQATVDQKRRTGMVRFKVVWQTGATTEHWHGRRVRSYTEHADAQRGTAGAVGRWGVFGPRGRGCHRCLPWQNPQVAEDGPHPRRTTRGGSFSPKRTSCHPYAQRVRRSQEEVS